MITYCLGLLILNALGLLAKSDRLANKYYSLHDRVMCFIAHNNNNFAIEFYCM